jgi:hypothetical protein
VLEAVARAIGVPTRVRGLLVDGVFWYPRFPRSKPLVPERVLLAWPEFLLDGERVPIPVPARILAEPVLGRRAAGRRAARAS